MLDRSREWAESDLQQLIQAQVPESVSLDYKRAAALAMQDDSKRKIGRDVSAFANSAGGVIVYGMAEDGHIPTSLDPVSPPFTKEWLEGVISSNVQPRIDGLHINPVPIAGGEGPRFVYVVTIPQSLTAHQAADRKYYKRFNFESAPMEHYEVQDTMNRAKTPIVSLHIDSRILRRSEDAQTYQLLMRLENTGARAAQHLKLRIWFPQTVDLRASKFIQRGAAEHSGRSGQRYRAIELEHSWSDVVLFPSDAMELPRWGATIDFEIDEGKHDFLLAVVPAISWTVYADDMAPRSGSRPFDFIDF